MFIPIINARFDLMIINAKTDKEANALSQISLRISLWIIGVVTPIGLFCTYILNDFFFEIVSFMFLLIFVSLTNVFTSYLNLVKKYKHISLINITRSLIMVILQVSIGYLNFGYIGLIIGFTLSYIAGITIGYKQFKKIYQSNKNKRYIYKTFKTNINQLKYSTPSALMNSLSFSTIVFLIGFLYTPHDVGIYGMATRILNVPVVVAGLGLSKIFMQKANEDFNKFNSFREILNKFSVILLILAATIYIPLLAFNEKLIVIVLGKDWIGAAELFLPLVILYAVRLVVSTISLSNIVIGKQKLDLVFQFVLLLISIITSVIAFVMKLQLCRIYYFKFYRTFVWIHLVLHITILLC